MPRGAQARAVFRSHRLEPATRRIPSTASTVGGADRIIRTSWTLADLASQDKPTADEIGYALYLWLGAGL